MTSAETERLLDGPVDEADERGSSGHDSRRANYGQLIMVLMVLLCEPIVAFMPMPFLAQLVNETGITKGDESQTGYYVGLIESCFFLTQGLCILHWGSLSDRIGRRPVLLIGLLGLTLSMLSFGLSQSFTAVVLSRIIAGVLNGNVGVAKTMIVELTDESNRAWSMTLLPITWITGATLTPIVGGALQHPAERFEMFKDNAFLKQNPYFLPCFVAVAACGFTWIATFFFLRETLTTAKDKKKTKSYGSTGAPSDSESEETAPPAVKAGSIKAVITRPVLIAIMNYGWLALLEISYWAILTVFLPVPVSAGGLNLPPPTVGIIFGTLGLFDGLLQLIAFPATYKRFGPKKIMIATFVSFWAIYACFPIMHELAKAHPTEPGSLHPGVWVAMGALVLFAGMIDMGYSVNFMFVSAAAPDPTLLGTTNGLAQMVISFTRALGPVGATSLFSISTTHPRWLGLHGYGVFVFLALLTGVAVYCSTLLPEEAKVDKDD